MPNYRYTHWSGLITNGSMSMDGSVIYDPASPMKWFGIAVSKDPWVLGESYDTNIGQISIELAEGGQVKFNGVSEPAGALARQINQPISYT